MPHLPVVTDRRRGSGINHDRALQRRAVFEEMARRFNTAVVTRTAATLEEASSRAAADKRRQVAFESRLSERRDRVAAVTAHLDHHSAMRAAVLTASNALLDEDLEERIAIALEEIHARGALSQSAVELQEVHLRHVIDSLREASMDVLRRLSTCQRQRLVMSADEQRRRAALLHAENEQWNALGGSFAPGVLLASYTEYIRVCEAHERALLESAESARMDRVAVAEIIARPRAEIAGAATLTRLAMEDERLAFVVAAKRGLLASLADTCARICGQSVPLFTDDELPVMMQRAAVIDEAARGYAAIERDRLESLAALWDAARSEAQQCVVQQTLRELNSLRRGVGRGGASSSAARRRLLGPPLRPATERDAMTIQRAWRQHRERKDPRRGIHMAWSQFTAGTDGASGAIPPSSMPTNGPPGVEVPEGFAADEPPPRTAFTRGDPWDVVRRLFNMRKLPDEGRQPVCGIWVSTIRDLVDGGYYVKLEHTRGMTWEDLCASGRDPLRDASRTVHIDLDFSASTNLAIVDCAHRHVVDLVSDSFAHVALPPGEVLAIKLLPVDRTLPVTLEVGAERGIRFTKHPLSQKVTMRVGALSRGRGFDLFLDNAAPTNVAYDVDFAGCDNLGLLQIPGAPALSTVRARRGVFISAPSSTRGTFVAALRLEDPSRPCTFRYSTSHVSVPAVTRLPAGIYIATQAIPDLGNGVHIALAGNPTARPVLALVSFHSSEGFDVDTPDYAHHTVAFERACRHAGALMRPHADALLLRQSTKSHYSLSGAPIEPRQLVLEGIVRPDPYTLRVSLPAHTAGVIAVLAPLENVADSARKLRFKAASAAVNPRTADVAALDRIGTALETSLNAALETEVSHDDAGGGGGTSVTPTGMNRSPAGTRPSSQNGVSTVGAGGGSRGGSRGASASGIRGAIAAAGGGGAGGSGADDGRAVGDAAPMSYRPASSQGTVAGGGRQAARARGRSVRRTKNVTLNIAS